MSAWISTHKYLEKVCQKTPWESCVEKNWIVLWCFFGLWYQVKTLHQNQMDNKNPLFLWLKIHQICQTTKNSSRNINGTTISTHSPKRALAKSDTKTVIMMQWYPFCVGRIFWPPPVLRPTMGPFFHRFNGWFDLVEIVGNSTPYYYKPPWFKGPSYVHIYINYIIVIQMIQMITIVRAISFMLSGKYTAVSLIGC